MRATKRRPNVFDRWATALEHKHLANADVIIPMSRLLEEELRQLYGVKPERIRLIYPAVATGKFCTVDAPRRAALRKSLGFPEDRIVFVFLSSSHKRKGFDLLRDYFGATDLPVTLAVAGRPVPEGLCNVTYLGYRSDVEQVYQAADFTVLASLYEPFGLVAIESVLCGTPVLLAGNMGCCEVIADDAREVFKAQDIDSLDAAVRRAVDRVKEGKARLQDPQASLHYSTDVVDYTRQVLSSIDYQ
jgi:glycosyltransferase involved in cell wall biosynthesis